PGQSLLEFDFTDTHYRDLLVRKYDSNNSWLLANAQFELESISLEDPAAGSTVRRNGTTDENGELLFKDLPNGVYKLTEIAPPTGYDMPDPHEWEITITSMSDRVIEFAVNNDPREGLTITKHDAITNKPLAGVEFSVRYLGDGNDSSDTSNETRTYITDENGVIHIPDIVPGWYEIREISVPDGYVLDPEPRLIEIINAHDTVTVPFHNYQDTQLIVLKEDAQTGLPLPGARFVVTTAGGTVIDSNLVTGPNGYATLSGLEPGSYVVREVEAPDGHIIDSTPQTFEITVGQTEPVFLVFSNDGKTALYIRKEDEQTRLPVAGAVFELRKVNGEVVEPRLETGPDGLVRVDDLDPGDYIVEEIEAPPGYVLSEDPEQTVSLEPGETETVLFRNNKPGGIAILKKDAFSGLPLPGAEFEITELDGSLVGRYTTGKDGYIRVPDLEAGYYYIQEIKAPEGYLLDSEKHQVKVEDFKVTLVELDNYEEASFIVKKIDAQSKVPLAGATFALYSMDGTQIGDPFTTGKNGQATLNDIEPGWYILRELDAPDGYVLNEEEFRVEIVEGQPTTLTVPNTPESGITVRKVDAVTKDPLAGAEFELRSYDGELLGNYTTDVSGSFVTVNVEPGVYYLTETKAPDGYAITQARTEVTVKDGEKPVVTIENHKNTGIQIQKVDSMTGAYLSGAEFEVRELSSDRVVGVYTTDRAGLAMTEPLPAGHYVVTETKAPKGYLKDETHHHVEVLHDSPAILRVSNQPLTGIMVTKVSTVDDEPLMGAKFEIRTAEGRVLGEVTTDTTGTATFPLTEPGVYYVHEVEPPDGYLLDDTVHRVEVVAGEMTPLVVENAPEASLVIFKGDADTGRGIAGAVFEVEHVDGAFIGRYTTDAQGEALVRPIEPGHYIVTEVSAPDGYEISGDPQKTITVLPGRINRVVFEDVAHGSLLTRLEDKADGSPLPNGRFQLFEAATGEMLQEGVTGNDGVIDWGRLAPGDYIVRQTYAPDGYTMTEKEKRETVVSGETRTVVFQNVTAGIVIEKLDRITSDPLAGARFKVTRDEDGIVIGEFVTDEDGLALVSGLVPGMYTVEEIVAPTGYEMDSEPQLVHVKASQTAHATFTDTPYAGITIHTVDQSNEPLAGVTVEVWEQNGGLVDSFTSDGTGTIQTNKLASGHYAIKVIKAPDGYTAETSEAAVELKDGAAADVRLVFNAGGTLAIHGLTNDGHGLAGMRVDVTTIDGSFIGSYTTDATGIIQVPDLASGWYVVTVTKAPDGYTIPEVDKAQNVEINSGANAELKFYFGKTFGVQIRTSVEQTGAMVEGAQYSITRMDGSKVGTYTSDKAGLIYVDLEPGWYVIAQTKLPKGYEGYSLCQSRNVEVKADQPTIVDFILTQLSSMRVKVVDGTTEAPIYGVKMLLRDGSGTIVDEYTTNNEGYITLKKSLADGTYTLTMTAVPDGYTVDSVPKTVEVLNGETTEIVWKLYDKAGQIQVHLTSTAYNPTLDLPAGSDLAGAVFEVYDPFTYAVVATIQTDSNGVAATSGLPIGRYMIREKSPAPYYGLSGKETEVYIKINNDVVRVEYQAAPLDLKVTHKITGNANVSAGSFAKYIVAAANNDSGTRMDNFFLDLKIPTDAVRGGTLFTGKWSSDVAYRISYKTNMNDYRPMATGLSSASTYQYDLSSLALDVQSGEYVTDIRFEFGTVPAGFKVVSSPVFYGYVMPSVPNKYIVIMRSECGGQYSGFWKTESALCTTNVVNNGGGLPNQLPKTGY
ncbi:SpaA isopeptide-forming pilin-related protein, partial [uncultured Flavonifractor sp.]|uniref:SpaA isopeptide-forming pilin-related protein n=1 Tax=uncultured Flavonifractor sp. TaxID=1193534 RepID=UPI002595422E